MTSSPAAAPDAEREKLHRTAQALEALVLKQLVTASKVFTGGEGAGSSVRAGMFADALADAMVKGGGIGLAAQIERSLAGPGAASLPSPTSLVPAGVSPGPALSGTTGAAPLEGALRVTSAFGLRQDPFDGRLTRHAGVDLAGREGDQIRAVAGGVVRRAGELGGYGMAVEIDHGDGLTTLYGHASELLVRDGDRVTPGQSIARVGHSGRATGDHVHFELRQGGRPIDPARALKSYLRP
jgi:murein DD-endopeptidase MepM/ murein hydrolase activator NlpD